MPKDTFTVYLDGDDGATVPVTVTRKHVKNLNLRVTPAGQVHASAPLRASRASIEQFIERHRHWILDRLAQQAERLKHTACDASLTPETLIPLWGKRISVGAALAHNFDESFPRRQETFAAFIGQSYPSVAPDHRRTGRIADLTPGALETRIRTLYRSEVARILPDIVRRYELEMNVAAGRCTIRSMKTRWGSCTPRTGAIRIALELAQYPPACLDMVVAHELVHLMEPSHNARFHMLLDCYCPDNRELSQRLKQPPAPLENPEP